MYYTDKPNVIPQEKLKIPYNILSAQKRIICTLYKAYTPIFIQSNCQTINKFTRINNVFTLKFYNGNWLLDVVTATLGIKNDICLSSRQILLFFCKRRRCLCIYIYILMLLLVIGTSRNTKNHIDYHRKM